MSNNKTKRVVSLLLLIAMLVGIIPSGMADMSYATGNTKTMTIEFEEQLDGSNRSKSVNIPKLKNVVSVTSNTGNITHSINGENVTVNVSGGSASKQVNNPKKYSKTVTDSSTSSSNSFSSTKACNSGGYSGSLGKSGASSVISGSYTPAQSRTETDTRTTQGSNTTPANVSYSSGRYVGTLSKGTTTNKQVQTGGSYTAAQSRTETATRSSQGSNTTPASVPYNSGGYSGTLSKGTTTNKQVQTGGSPADSKYVTAQTIANYNSGGYSGVLSKYVYSGSYTPADSKTVTQTGGSYTNEQIADCTFGGPCVIPTSISYNSGGYSGTLGGNLSGNTVTYAGTVTRPASDTRVYRYQGTVSKPDTRTYRTDYASSYSGTVIKPATDTRTYRTDYTSNYSGTVTKPAVDTRTWEQNYSGTVYMAGNDDYYKYTVTIEYIDNSDPIISVISPTNDIIRSAVSGYTNLDISGTVKDIDADNTLTVKYKLSTGATGTIKTVTADGSNQEFNHSVNVSDLENGNHSIVIWAEDDQGGKSAEISRSFVVDKTLPKITFNNYTKTPTNKDITVTATTNKGSLNKSSHTFTENDSFEFVATDAAGNVAKQTVKISNIDKVLPVITINEYITTPTNKDVTVTATTSKGALNKESHIFDKNGSFEFVATDEAGNITKETVTITNIDKVAPVITVSDYIKTLTNKDITVTVITNKGTLNKASHTFATNGSFEFVATDSVGNVSKEIVTIANIDKVLPVITVGEYIKSPTNQDIAVRVTADKGTFNKNEHTFTENGSFEFIVTDEAGNINKETVTITNINKVLPVITVEDYIKTPTNEDITVKVTANKGTFNENSHIFAENGSFEFVVTDTYGNIAKETVTITNIDKVSPTKPTLAFSNDKIVLTEGTDAGSGIEKHMYSINDSTFKEWSSDLDATLFEDGVYKIVVKAIDKASNESELGPLTITTNYQEIRNKTDKAEETLDRDDYDKAKDLVDNMEEGDLKDELLDELGDILNKIEEKEFADLIGGSENEEDVKKAEDTIKDSNLPEDVKEELLDQLDKKIRELTSWAVGIAEAVSREPYLGTAEAFIDMLKDSPEKTEYQARMTAVYSRLGSNTEITLKDAERAVALAEANKREASVDNANKVVKALRPSPEKTAFEERMKDLEDSLAEEVPVVEEVNTPQELKRAEDSVAIAERMKREAFINSARTVVNNLKDSAEKIAFIERLDNI